jgi:hypothetical protein
LKPANIMIDGRGQARITDFGIAVMAQSSVAGEIAGTPAYMAPEQLVEGRLSAQTDLFALGLILQELLTGKRMLQATSLQQRWLTHRDAEDLARSAIGVDVDPLLQKVIARWFETTQTQGELAVERSALYEAFIRVSRPSERSGVFFVYRQSPQLLVPENVLGVVAYREPPADVPGMVDVTLDPLGRLVRLTAVPGSLRGSPTPRDPDWSGLFSEAGLDFSSFKPVETTWRPPVAHDIVAAWEGGSRDRPAERIRVRAAAWDGRPVVFDTTDNTSSPTMNQSVRWGGPASQLVFVLMTLTALAGAGILARWNIRQGRWDRSGALQVAGSVFGVGLLLGLLRADHVPIARDEYLIFARIASWYLYSAGFIFLMYVAFEPFVRQRWPRVLTSWTRLVSGRVSDPLVGRDIVIGALAGVAIALLRGANSWLPGGWGSAPPHRLRPRWTALGRSDSL